MKANERMGEVLREGEQVALRYVRELRHPPEKVWAALTESEHLRAWMPIELVGERAAGAALQARFWPDFVAKYGIDAPELPAEILVWDPPKTFEWRWDKDLLRFELEPITSGTRLVFSTTIGIEQIPGHKTAAGYHLCLRCLQEHLDEGTTEVPLLDQPTDALEARYEEKFAAPSTA
jgi:uncharacterized protein YndB with AHSA1/START domain